MTEKIPSFKKEIDDIYVPIDKLDAIIANTVQERPLKKKRKIRNKIIYYVGAAIIFMSLLIGSVNVSPVMANFVSQLPIIGSIFSEFGDKGLEKVSNLGLTQVIGESKTIGGTTITIDEVFYDGTRFTLSYSVKKDKPFEGDYMDYVPKLTYDGEKIGHKFSEGLNEDRISPNQGTVIYSVSSIGLIKTELPKEFVLGISFDGESGEHWTFSVPVKEQSEVELVTINHSQVVEGIELTVSDLKIGAAGLLLTYNTWSNNYNAGYLRFHIVDSLGNVMEYHSGSNSGRFFNYGDYLYDPVDPKAKSLTITPMIVLPPAGTAYESHWDGTMRLIDYTMYEGVEFDFESIQVDLPN